MMSKNLILCLFFINCFVLISCSQQVDSKIPVESIVQHSSPPEYVNGKLKDYIDWYCPDNTKVLPPIDIKDLGSVPVVRGRLPLYEETLDARSLMYFDTTNIPSARPLDIPIPSVARYYSKYSKKSELVIVIQAIIAKNDTIIGFRFLNGGNGTARIKEIDFLTYDEVTSIPSTPFVVLDININASKNKIWNIIKSSTYENSLSELLPVEPYLGPDFNEDSEKNDPDRIVSSMYENVYMQIDYNKNGHQFVKKYFLSEDHFLNCIKLRLIAGPFIKDFNKQEKIWHNWLQELKIRSENSK